MYPYLRHSACWGFRYPDTRACFAVAHARFLYILVPHGTLTIQTQVHASGLTQCSCPIYVPRSILNVRVSGFSRSAPLAAL